MYLGHVNVRKNKYCMKRYKAIVKASGLWVETIVFAQNTAQAYALFKSIYGANNVPHMPTETH